MSGRYRAGSSSLPKSAWIARGMPRSRSTSVNDDHSSRAAETGSRLLFFRETVAGSEP